MIANAGHAVMRNGLGDPDAIEAERAAIEQESGMRVLFDGADMADTDQITGTVLPDDGGGTAQ